MATQEFNVVRDNNGDVVPVVQLGTATPISATVSSSATTAESLAGNAMFRVTSDQNVWLKFGDNSVEAAADGDDSLLFLAGTEVFIIPEGTTHWSGIRATGNDAVVQFFAVNER